MRKQGTIEYELLIQEPEGNGVIYQSNIDSDLACMLIAADVLQSKIESAKDAKKQAQNKKMKDLIGRNINLMSRGLAAINDLTSALCGQYDEYVKWMENKHAQEEAEKIWAIENGQIPPDTTE
jgi:c-di-GMP-related signal transduction protein